jgi:nucleotide-binding universal stress UspA family protein
MRRILVPTDFSPPAARALDVAMAFAEEFGAEIMLFHAHELPTAVFPDAVVPIGPELLRDLEAAIARQLNRESERVHARGIEVRTVTAIGQTDGEICRAAQEWPADLIVMGTHGRTGLSHLLLGSVAEKVVRKAPCPVLTVRPDAAEHVAP